MPSLYGNTTTSYTVTASNVSTLYMASTNTVFTATTYSTNLAGLYGGSYAALPTNAEQLIQLFDNSGNVNFYLDPLTNSSTIFANFIGTATLTVGNFQFSGNTMSNVLNQGIYIETNGETWGFDPSGIIDLPATGIQNINPPNGQLSDQYWVAPPGGQVNLASNNGDNYVWVDDGAAYIGTNWTTTPTQWTFNTDGTTQFPGYLFPAGDGTNGQVLTTDGSGTLTWNTINGGVTDITAGTGISVSTSTGSVVISNIGVTSLTAGTGTYISTSTGDITIWSTGGGGGVPNQVFDFGSFLVPVSFTLDMGAFI